MRVCSVAKNLTAMRQMGCAMNVDPASVSQVRVSQNITSSLPRRGFSLATFRKLLRNCFASLHAPRRRGKNNQGNGFSAGVETPEARLVLSAVNAAASLTGSVTFDFGTDQSPVDPDALQVSDTIRYTATRGFGMTSDVRGIDRGRDDDLLRDFVEGPTVGFRVDLPDGIYQVEPMLGDRLQLRERMQVSINGEVRGLITTLGGTSATPSYYVEVQNGRIDIEVTDLGGESPNAALAALTITALDNSAGIPQDSPAQAANRSPLLVVMTHGRVTPPKQDGGLMGTVVSKLAGHDVKENMPGEDGDVLGEIVEGAVKSAFPSEGRPDVSDWVYELPRALAKATRREGLDSLNPNVRPIPLPKIEKAASDEELLNLLKGSQDFIATNWSTESSFGTPQTAEDIGNRPWDVYNERQHRQAVMRAATATFRMMEARIRQEIAHNPLAKVDLLIVGHSFGATVNREVVLMLNTSPLADHIDFVKIVELDPVAIKPDPNPAERAASHDRYFWQSPAAARNGKPLVDSIVNYYQTEGLAFTGILEKGLITGVPLDGYDGGGLLGFRNGQAMVFSTQTGDTLDQFQLVNNRTGKPAQGALRNGVYSPDGRLIALASEDGTVSLCDAVTHAELRRIAVSKEFVTDVQFMPNSAEIITVSKDGQVRIFSAADGALLWTGRHQASPLIKGVSPDNPLGTTVYRGAKVLAISKDGRLLATGGTANNIRIWLRTPGTATGFEVAQTIPGHSGGTTTLAFAPDGSLVTGGEDGQVRIWKQGTAVYEMAQVLDLGAPVQKSVFSKNGKSLATASGKTVSLWMAGATGEWIRVREFADHVNSAQALAFSMDDRFLATGGADHTIFIYNTLTGEKVNVLNQAMLEIRNLAFSPDGTRLLATYFDLKGGPIRDVNVTDQVRSRVGFFENLFAGGSKHHSEVPFVYIDLVVRKTNDSFFEMRDKPRASRYGDFEPGDLTQKDTDRIDAISRPQTPDGGGDDELSNPWIDQISNWHAPEFINTIPTMTVTDTLAVSLRGLAIDADGNTLQWTVRSSNTDVLLATIDGESLVLRPLQEGQASIELTANDGHWAAQIQFTATADGSIWRGRADQLRNEAMLATEKLRILQQAIEPVETAIDDMNRQWKELDSRIGGIRASVTELQKDVASATSRVDRARQTQAAALASRTAAESALARAETNLQNALANHARIDATTRQLFQTFSQRQDERQQARQRLDNASKSNRAARQADFNRASEAAAAAEANWRNSQSQRDSAQQAVDAARNARNNMNAELNRNSRLLAEAESDIARAQKDLKDATTRLTTKLAQRKELLDMLNDATTRLDSLVTQLQSLQTQQLALATHLQNLNEQLGIMRQSKWVTRIGLDKTEETILNPATARSNQTAVRLEELVARVSRVREKITSSSSQVKALG